MRRPREQHSSFRFRFTSMESCLSKRTIESEYCLVIVTHRAPRPPPREFTNSAPTLFFKPRFPWTPCPPSRHPFPALQYDSPHTHIFSHWCVWSQCNHNTSRRLPVSKILATYLIDETVR